MSKRNTSAVNASSTPSLSESETAAAPSASNTGSIIAKALQKNGRWDRDSFPEFMLVLYWLRQFVGMVAGICCGIFAITGVSGLVIFSAANLLLPFGYYKHYANIKIDDFGATEILTEGFQPSFGIFCLFWVLLYTALHATP